MPRPTVPNLVPAHGRRQEASEATMATRDSSAVWCYRAPPASAPRAYPPSCVRRPSQREWAYARKRMAPTSDEHACLPEHSRANRILREVLSEEAVQRIRGRTTDCVVRIDILQSEIDFALVEKARVLVAEQDADVLASPTAARIDVRVALHRFLPRTLGHANDGDLVSGRGVSTWLSMRSRSSSFRNFISTLPRVRGGDGCLYPPKVSIVVGIAGEALAVHGMSAQEISLPDHESRALVAASMARAMLKRTQHHVDVDQSYQAASGSNL